MVGTLVASALFLSFLVDRPGRGAYLHPTSTDCGWGESLFLQNAVICYF